VIVTLKPHVTEKQYGDFMSRLRDMKLRFYEIDDLHSRSVSIVCGISGLDTDMIRAMEIVEDVKRIDEPYKAANRKCHPADTVVEIPVAGSDPVKIGGGHFCMIAGPCSVESEGQIIGIAEKLKTLGARILRGGVFKLRSSPYSFQGLGTEGIGFLLKAKAQTGLPVVTEIADISQLPEFEKIDVIQVGTRNMQNFLLLKELGKLQKPVLLKRGASSTIDEWLMAADYILSGGNGNVILCERGIRTFETATRNTLDIAAVPVVKDFSHLPVIVDPSHATGYAKYVESMSLASVAAGAHGLIIEVHDNPEAALSDGQQSITPGEFAVLSKKAEILRKAKVLADSDVTGGIQNGF